jgi:hypothetical protein
LSRLAAGTSFEFASNLVLDRLHPSLNISLQQVLMEIKSTVYPDFPVFHSIDKTWGSDSNVMFTFLPENNSDARMYIAGLIPYLRDTQDSWFLQAFTEEAKTMHRSSVWDPVTKQVSSTTDAWISGALALDDELNFTDIPTATWSPAQVQFDIPAISTGGATSALFRDQDSVSTFHPNQRRNLVPASHMSVDESKEEPTIDHISQLQDKDNDINTLQQGDNGDLISITTPIHGAALRGRSVAFEASLYNKNDDLISRISDNNSRISALESHFSTMSMQFTEAIEEMRRQSDMQSKHHDALNLILSRIYPSQHTVVTGIQSSVSSDTAGEQPSTSSIQANPLNVLPEAGGSSRAAGHGS